jgi:hypothetical protein
MFWVKSDIDKAFVLFCLPASCPIGQYFDNNRNGCQLCPIGYYQDEVGQFRCKGCNAGETTKETGATSIQQCSGKLFNPYHPKYLKSTCPTFSLD